MAAKREMSNPGLIASWPVDDLTLLHAQRDILLVNVLLPECSFDICGFHFPHSWDKTDGDDEDIAPAVTKQIAFIDLLATILFQT